MNVSSTTIAHGNEHPWAGVPEGFRVRFFADTKAFSQAKFSYSPVNSNHCHTSVNIHNEPSPEKRFRSPTTRSTSCTVGVNCTGATDAITTVAINRGASI